MRFSRRTFLKTAGALALGGVFADAALLEPSLVEFTEETIAPAVPAVAPGTRSVRFAQISDLHLHGISIMHAEIAARLIEIAPAFIVITGDAIDDRANIGLLRDFLGLLGGRIPIYATLGNWEHWGGVDLARLAELYAQHNGRLLVNETAEHRIGDARLLISGVDDSTGGEPSLEKTLAGVEPSPHHLVLAHSPVYRDYIADYTEFVASETGRDVEPVDLSRFTIACVLSGHTHGGQIVLPGFVPYLPVGSGSYLRGWYRDRLPHLYVSRGVGTTMLPIRFGARPEVTIFTMTV